MVLFNDGREVKDLSFIIYIMLVGLITIVYGTLIYVMITTGKFPPLAKPLFPFVIFLTLNWGYAYLYFTKPIKGNEEEDLVRNVVRHIPYFIVSIVVSIISNEVIKGL